MGVLSGQLSEAERARRLQAVPLAMQLGGAQAPYPLTQVSAAQQYGALPRELEQAQLQSQYQEFLRQQGVEETTINQILSFMGAMPTNQGALQAQMASGNVLKEGYSSGTTQLVNALQSAGLGQSAMMLPSLGTAQTNALFNMPTQDYMLSAYT